MPDLEIELAGQTVRLLPERALYWPRAQTLLVADVHFGKTAALRALAIPVPGGTTRDDLARLTAVLERTRAKRIVFLGDLFHAREGRAAQTLGAVAAWRDRHRQAEMLLVRGNHDRRAGDPPAEWSIVCVDEPLVEAPFVLMHDPAETPAGYALGGHIHPAVRLSGSGKQTEKLACFHFAPRIGTLPAFGSFTGTALLGRGPGDRIFAIADSDILPVPIRTRSSA